MKKMTILVAMAMFFCLTLNQAMADTLSDALIRSVSDGAYLKYRPALEYFKAKGLDTKPLVNALIGAGNKYIKAGEKLSRDGEYDKARNAMNEAFQCYRLANKFDKAYDALLRSIALGEHSNFIHARAYAKEYNRDIGELEDASASGGFKHREIGDKYYKKGNYAYAKSEYSEAARCYSYARKFEQLRAVLELSLDSIRKLKEESKGTLSPADVKALKGEEARVLNDIGSAYMDTKDYKNALKYFDLAIKNGNSRWAHFNRAMNLAMTQGPDEAYEVYMKSLRILPDPNLFYELAIYD